MNKILLLLSGLIMGSACAQPQQSFIPGERVFENKDVMFHKIDNHTWVGTGNLMANESVYLIEGNDMALLLDAGTEIERLDEIVATITSKPITLVATHLHPDHTGSAINDFPEIWINAAEVINIPLFMPNYRGKIKYLTDGQIFDLGGRQIEVVFTPGHTQGSTSFIDKSAKYGFSGDAFGSGNLLLTTTFSSLWASAKRIDRIFESHELTKLYPGHYFGTNHETHERIKDIIQICEDVFSGEEKGQINEQATLGLDRIIIRNGFRISFSESALK